MLLKKMLFTPLFLLLIGMSSISFIASSAEVEIESDTSKLPECRFGIPPWQKTRKFNQIRKDYAPLLNWLTEQVGCQFVLITAKTYKDLEKQLEQGVLHVAEIGAISYVTVEQKLPEIRPIVTALQWSKDNVVLADSYYGHILTLKDNQAINSLADLQDKSFGFVRKESSSGYRYPNVLLKEAGIDYQHYFSQVFFLGSHPNVTDAIKAGSIAAGVTWEYNWRESKKKHGDIFKSIARTSPIPNVLLVAHPSLPAEIYTKMQQVLPHIDAKLLEHIPADGFVVRPTEFYDAARKVAEMEATIED
ncbi:PhnD/SsuA/transferrin family substrate-binding protein [Candidatus Albibeggiatoa sp. nov. BB20]|uniref:phosphate/phosphite/phosphonate ABC transporter substrate-binding protein n=1 Tax=Candidatus Albibeggiatoa sp. nov. BB20 TaxID=3162723 RepID=UPI00336552EC